MCSRSIRGPKGGYVVGHDRRKLTLADIVNSIELEADADSQSVIRKAALENVLADLHEHVMLHLQNVTLQDVCHPLLGKQGKYSLADFAI